MDRGEEDWVEGGGGRGGRGDWQFQKRLFQILPPFSRRGFNDLSCAVGCKAFFPFSILPTAKKAHQYPQIIISYRYSTFMLILNIVFSFNRKLSENLRETCSVLPSEGREKSVCRKFGEKMKYSATIYIIPSKFRWPD